MASGGHKPVWIFFDLETTGLSPIYDRIIEIGAVAATPPEMFIKSAKFSSLVKTDYPISVQASLVHNIFPDDLADQEYFNDVFGKLIDWISSTITDINKATRNYHFPVLIAHNGFYFDFPILFTEISRAKIDYQILRDCSIHFADTLCHFRELKKTGTCRTLQDCRLSLNSLYEIYFPHLEFKGHRALTDAEYIRDLLMDTELKSSVPTIEIKSIDEILSIVKDKKIRSDLRRQFGVKSWQGNRLRDLGLTCGRLKELFVKYNRDINPFKMKLLKLGVYSDTLRDKIAETLQLIMTNDE